jgi:Flp pilus assembly protein TadG
MPQRLTFIAALRRFRRNRNGSAAVEFAMVAPMFIGLLFAILESAMVFFASQVLETVTQDSARMIMTGQEQSAGKTQADFKAVVCSKVNALFNCTNGITVDVQSAPAFGTISLSDPVDAACNYSPPNNYLPGGPGDIVVVRLFYQWPIFVTGFGFNLSCGSGSTRILTATAAFQNEPY